MAQNTFDPSTFTTQKAKPFPVILMLDTSDSMNIITDPSSISGDNGRIEIRDGQRVRVVDSGITRISILNNSIRKMLNTFSRYERKDTELFVSIVTFGGEAQMVLPPTLASNVQYNDLPATGNTPLGRALNLVKGVVEDRSQIPSRSYRPLIVLASDGYPNDNWETTFEDFIHNGRTAKCDRMALAIGDQADRNMLARFIEGTNRTVFEADSADKIEGFFEFLTMSTVARTHSKNPDVIPPDSEIPVLVEKIKQDGPDNPNTSGGNSNGGFFW